jgi:hypothetical protein
VVFVDLAPNKKVIWGMLALFAIYFPVALWLKVSYVPIKKLELAQLPSDAIRLVGPFFSFANSKLAFVAAAPALDSLADFGDELARSPFLLYENRSPLGPAHSLHNAIVKEGRGRFSHWKDIGFVFSTSDNTNPNTNGRHYWVVRLKREELRPIELPSNAIPLVGPFFSFANSETAFVEAAPALDGVADSLDELTRSPFLLYENDTPLGPAHSLHDDIVKEGGGRFSHWKGIGFIFSASDNTNPNTNGRHYWVVRR